MYKSGILIRVGVYYLFIDKTHKCVQRVFHAHILKDFGFFPKAIYEEDFERVY